MSKTGWANAVGSIGQGLLVFGANREKINYEKERDAHLLELEREQMAALKDYQRDTLTLKGQEVVIAGDVAKASIAASGAATSSSLQSVEESKAQIKSLQLGDAQKNQDFKYTQKLLGNRPVTNEDGDVTGYEYDAELYKKMQPQRDNELRAKTPLSANMQLINAATESMVEGQKETPNGPQYNVTNADGTTRPKTAAEFKAESITDYYHSTASVYRDIPTEKALDGVDDQIQALETRLSKGQLTMSDEDIATLQKNLTDLQDRRLKILAGYGSSGLLGNPRATTTGGDPQNTTGGATTPGGTAYLNTLNIDPTATD
jgi:hypothetical protein